MVITCWRFPASVRWVPPQWMTSLPLLHHEIQPERQHSDHEKTQAISVFFLKIQVGNTPCISTCFMLTMKVMNAMGEVGVVGLFFCWNVRFVELWTVSCLQWSVGSWILRAWDEQLHQIMRTVTTVIISGSLLTNYDFMVRVPGG